MTSMRSTLAARQQQQSPTPSSLSAKQQQQQPRYGLAPVPSSNSPHSAHSPTNLQIPTATTHSHRTLSPPPSSSSPYGSGNGPNSASTGAGGTFGLTSLSAQSYRNPKTLTFDDAVIPPIAAMTTLPATCNFLVITTNILTSSPAAAGSHRKFWDDALQRPEFKDLVSDGFWWVLRHKIMKQPEPEVVAMETGENESRAQSDPDMPNTDTDTDMASSLPTLPPPATRKKALLKDRTKPPVDPAMAQYKDPYFLRMSTNFVKMFEKVSEGKKGLEMRASGEERVAKSDL